MGYWLGIDVGSTFTAAAVCRGDGTRWGSPEVVALGSSSAVVSSVVYLGENGQVVVGEVAQRRTLTDPDRVVRGFKQRIGDEVPMVIGGKPYPAAQVAAMVIQWVIAQVAAREGGPAAGILVTHPAGWGNYKVEVLVQALRAAGVPDVRFVTEPEAAAAGYAVQQRVGPGRTIAVYDLGGGTFDAAVVRTSAAGGFSVLGQPHGLEALGGVDFDDAVFTHVQAAVPALAELDPDDPAALAATAALRRECTQAKEALSADTEVTIPVLAPGISTQVRLHRAEFEDLIRPHITDTIHALRATLRSARLEPGELDAVLLVGGSSRIPLVTQLLSAGLSRPVAVDADPTTAIALGAAQLALPIPATAAAPQELPAADPPSPAGQPQPPSLTAVPFDVEPAGLQRRRARSRRVKQLILAGVMAVMTAVGVTLVPFLTAHSDASPPASPGTPPSSPPPAPGTGTPGENAASPAVSTGSGGEDHRPRAAVRPTTPAAALHPADALKPGPTSAVPDLIRPPTEPQVSSWSNPPPTTTPAPPTTTPEPTTPAPTPPS
ncbi:MAG TPA: Hsp70 family protein, partial [Pseudonocardiaceae bacterium]|nr:Hsp70 family protein [Pseudonocardiaceae bacterium]